jgi:hypothetical protein
VKGVLDAAAPGAAVDKLAADDNATKGLVYTTNPTTANMTKTDVRNAVRDGVVSAVQDVGVVKAIEDVKTAVDGVKDAVNDMAQAEPAEIEWGEFSGENVSAEDTPSPPGQNATITGILTGAMTQWRSLPILSWLTDWHIEIIDEDPVLVLPIPWGN